jgi:hypothetical protein
MNDTSHNAFKLQLKSDGSFIGSKYKSVCHHKGSAITPIWIIVHNNKVKMNFVPQYVLPP